MTQLEVRKTGLSGMKKLIEVPANLSILARRAAGLFLLSLANWNKLSMGKPSLPNAGY